MGKKRKNSIEAIVIGTSQGGFDALKSVLEPLPADFPAPILVVRHQSSKASNYLVNALNQTCHLKVKFAKTDDQPLPGVVYIAPPDKHLLVGKKGRLKLSAGEPVNFSRPAIDPLFESAAMFYGPTVLAVALTGANSDGAMGLRKIQKKGGKVMVQDPDSAEAEAMPKAALAAVEADYVIWLDQIGPQLWSLTR